MPFSDKAKTKEYYRQYHLKNWPQRKARHQELKRIRRNNLAAWLKIYKKNLVCAICTENHPACLDFHHLNGKDKDATVSNMISEGYAKKTILFEISKCIILCKNCHSKKHYRKT